MISTFSRLRKSERGIALVLTISVLVLLTIMILTFAITMRVEHAAVKNYNDALKSRVLARTAVDQAIALLLNATPVITNAPLTTYVTAPGMIYTYKNNAWSSVLLFTTDASNAGNLNEGNWITGVGGTYPAGTLLPFGWSNVTSSAGSLVGRVAYWVDDDSTKVNVDTANKRSSTAEKNGWTTAAIDLTKLAGTVGFWLPLTSSPPRSYDTAASILSVAGMAADDYAVNKFYITVNSSSPDITPWGSKRLNLSNVVATAANPVQTIATALSDPNLTAWYGQTFSNKYPNVRQIAANIVDYTDTNSICTDSGAWNDTTPPQYLGLENTPYLNELVISNLITVATNGLGGLTLTNTATTVIELRNLYTTAWTPPAGTEVYLANRPSIIFSTGDGPITFSSPATIPALGAMAAAGAGPGPDTYFTNAISQVTNLTINATNNITVTLNSGTVTAIYRSPSGRMDYAVIPLTNYTYILNGPASGSFTTNLCWTAQCNDPRVKPVSTNWNAIAGGTILPGNSLGQGNSGTVFYGLTNSVNGANIVSDGDYSCHQYSRPLRDRGTMTSAEFAFIHTGVPWRTFWLQPNSSTPPTAPIPDWAAIDLFSTTDPTNVAGRININAAIANAGAPIPPRTVPLLCLLAPSSGSYNANTAINNIFSFVPTAGLPFCPGTNTFTTAGQLCEVAGMYNSAWGTKLVAEAPLRTTINNVTTRSNTFTIWAFAQSIMDINNNGTYDATDIITGETKVQAIVERYENPPGTVRFRILYYRYSGD